MKQIIMTCLLLASVLVTACNGSTTTGGATQGADGVVTAEGQDPEFNELQYRFTARFAADGTAAGTVLQKGAGCTTYELEWTARKE